MMVFMDALSVLIVVFFVAEFLLLLIGGRNERVRLVSYCILALMVILMVVHIYLSIRSHTVAL